MRRNGALALLPLLAAFLLGGCATTGGSHRAGPRPAPPVPVKRGSETGVASYYARIHHGRRTASGALHDENAMVAAHRTLPFGSRTRVTNLANGRSVIVTVNDRGPFRAGRIVDVSRRAARELGMLGAGTVRVRLEVVERVSGASAPTSSR